MKLFKMLQSVTLSDGFSWDFRNECAPTAGYAVSCSKDTEVVLDHCPTALEIADYVIEHSFELLEGNIGEYEMPKVLGLWEDSGKWYLDISDIAENLEDALYFGKLYSQIAVFDIANFQTVYVNGSN